jgi:Polyketide cyclase / dehydrase and lipid transport
MSKLNKCFWSTAVILCYLVYSNISLPRLVTNLLTMRCFNHAAIVTSGRAVHHSLLVLAMQIEHRIQIATLPDVIFTIYENVAHWHTWDPDTKQAVLDGPLRVGAKGRLTPTKGMAVPMLITEVVANRSFTVDSKIPLFRMVFEHELLPHAAGTEVLHRVTFSGLLAKVLGPMLIKQLNVGLPVTLGRLKQLAESRGAV